MGFAADDQALRSASKKTACVVKSVPVVTGISWRVDGDLAFTQWLRIGQQLGHVGRSLGWWIGDWLQYGNERYGEKYVKASRVTGYDVHSLTNMAYVASRFSVGRRRGTLSWSHHAELAALEESEQEMWLNLAETQRLSVRDLRAELRDRRRLVRGAAARDYDRQDTTPPRSSTSVVCPRCQAVIALDPVAPVQKAGAHA